MKKGIILVLTIVVVSAGSVSAGTYSGGDGSAENPYQIATAENMNAIGARPNDWDNHFVLTADIDLSAYTGTQFNIIGTNYDNAFTGVFDGNGHMITNFTYTTTTTDCIGLFGYAGYRAVIKNLTLVAPNVNAAGESDYIGCLVGRLHGAISGCGVEGGSVTGYYFTGGLVGVNQQNGVITNSYVTGSVTGRTFTGGLAGYNYGGTVSNCYSTASASGDNDTGGLVGCNEYGTISDCYATGSVSGGGWKTGGLVGHNQYGMIGNCYAAGSVTGASYTGGLVGSGGQMVNCFWDIETSGQSQSAGGEGRTTAQMKTAGTFFAWEGCGSEGLWTIDEGNDYPRLAWEGRPGQPLQQLSDLLTGSGTAVDPYLIYTAEQLNLIGRFSCELDKHFRLASDIDLSGFSGTEFNIIGNSTIKFTGVFDGNDHTISNFTYTTTDSIRIGIFGWVDGANAAIKDLTLVTPDVNAAGDSRHIGCLVGCLRFGTITGCGVEGGSVSGDYYTGELVGYNYEGTISNCYAAGSVTGDEGTGGLVGHNSRGRISNCRAAGSVSGDYYTGGLVGRNYGTISNCYAAGSITGTNRTGGLVGENYSTISNCYAAGSVSGADNFTGGLVGDNDGGTIENCCATGSVTGYKCNGGLVGYNNGTILNCYAEGSVTGTDCTGGLVGKNYKSVIENCYAAGNVTGNISTGGLVGYNNDGTISASFWDIEIGGPDNGIGTGLPTSQMQTASTFTDVGWDFTTPIWKICEDNDYPRLWWQNYIPIADAGVNTAAYAWINGWAEVTLDGSACFDPDGGELTYLWSWTVDGNTYDVNGVSPVIELPVGEYVINLTVNDGIEDSEPNQVAITVIEALESHVLIFPRVINRYSRQKNILAWIWLPEGVDKEQINGEPILLYPGEIEAVRQHVIWHGRRGHKRTSILAFFSKAELMDAVVDNGEVELEAVGSLKSGRYFYGSDTVLIRGRLRRPRRLWHFN